jgi:hypothetical protein
MVNMGISKLREKVKEQQEKVIKFLCNYFDIDIILHCTNDVYDACSGSSVGDEREPTAGNE